MNRAIVRGSFDGSEVHHIVPKAVGGSNDPLNLVHLTLREHYIAHLLLPKILIRERDRIAMYQALWLMSNRCSRQTSRMYAAAKGHVSQRMKRCNPMHDPSIKRRQLVNKTSNYNHSEAAKRRNVEYWSNDANRAKLSKRNKARWSDPAAKARATQTARERTRRRGVEYHVTDDAGNTTVWLTKHECAIAANVSDSTVTALVKSGRPTRTGFTVKEVRVDSVPMSNPQNTD